MFIWVVYEIVTLEIDTDYYIEGTIFNMAKSRYRNLYKRWKVVGLVLIMWVN